MRAFQRAAGGAPDGLQSRPPDVDCGRILRGRTSCDRSTSFLGHGLGQEPSPDLRDDRGDRVGLPSPPPRPLTSSSSGSRTAGTRGASYSLRTRGPRGPEDHVPVSELAGIGPRISLPIGLHNLWNTEYMTREWGLPPRQLLLAGDGHWWISLDYRQRNDPEVWWLDTAIDDGLRLAPNFDDFLSGLRPESDVDPERGVLRPAG